VATASVAVRLNAITGEFEKAFTNATRTVSGFERTFANAASSIQGYQQSLNRAFADFSGDKLTRDAAALAAAITQIGGAAKLTEAEQRKVNATITEAIEKYRALGQQAPQSLLALANATKQLEEPTTRAGKAVDFLKGTFAQFTAANLAANAIQSVIGKMSEFIAQGAKLPGLQASFKNLTSGIGQDSQKMLSTLQESTRGMVSNIDLMQSANKAILLGLPVTTREMGDLAKAATVLGKAMGQDATKSLDDLITALGRSSPLILDNLGLTVKVGEANEAYAAKLGKTVEQLTDAEKKTAFYEAAMEKAREKVAQLGEQTKTLGEVTQSVWVAIGNDVTQTVANLDVAVGASIKNIEKLLRLKGLIPSGDAGGFGGGDLFSLAGRFSPVGALETNSAVAAELEAMIATARANLARIRSEAPKLADVFKAEGPNQFGQSVLNVTEYLKEYEKGLEKAKRAQESYSASVRALRDEFSGAKLRGDVKKLEDAWRGLSAEQKLAAPVMERVADAAQKLANQGASLSPELFQLTVTMGRFESSLPPVESGMKGIEKEFQDIAPSIRKSAQELIDFIAVLNHPNLKAVEGLSGLTLPGERVGKPLIPEPPVDMFREWIKAIDGISSALFRMAGDSQGSFARVIRDIAVVVDAFGQAAQAAQAYRAATTAAGRASALIEGAAAFWQATGAQNRGAATFGGAAAGAQIGGAIVPGWGHVIGGIAGAITGWVRSGGQGREEVEAFAESMGGFDELRRQLAELGDEGERLWRNLTQGVGSNNPEQAVAAINDVIAALDEFGTEAERAQRRLDALGQAVEGVNAKAANFASPFQALLDAQNAPDANLDAIGQKLAAAAQAGQAEFERLGVFVGATFAGIVNETGNAIGALQSLAPAISILQQGIEKFGLTSTSTIDQLVSLFGLVNDATTGPILSSIQATTQIFTGLQDAGYMTAELFQTVSDDIGASFRDLEAKGGDVAKAMALSQPILQKLWEAQQRYGDVTDETTAALLRQAEEQGLVGAHMQDVNQKILDVLIAIADVFGAVIPDSLRRTEDAATHAADHIEREFKNVRISIPVDFDINQPERRDLRPFNLESGGEGDIGPSSVSGPDASSATFIMNVDGRTLAEATVPYIPGEVQRFGLA
jgi:hypothetical protein